MSKKALKTTIIEKQKNIDPLTGKFLDPNLSLVDTDRILPKAKEASTPTKTRASSIPLRT